MTDTMLLQIILGILALFCLYQRGKYGPGNDWGVFAIIIFLFLMNVR